ncbi:MAG: hypothetical protein V5786_01545 [Psychromonas sp.]
MKLVFKSTLLFLSSLLFVQQLYASNKYSLSAQIGRQMSAVFELYELDKLNQTLLAVNKIRPRSAFEKAYIKRFQGNVYWQMGKEQKALQSLLLAVEINALSDVEQRQTERMLADLYLNQKQPTKAIQLYKTLIAEEASEDLYKHLALGYYQKKSWTQVVNASRNAIKLSGKFNQSLHVLQLSALYELKSYRNASKVLIKLTQHDASNKRWWMQLASTYRLLKQDKKALATYEQAYQLGFMVSSTEIRQLAYFRSYLGAPYQAAVLLESAMKDKKVRSNAKSYQQLAHFWQAAREHDKAQQYWGKSARLSGNTRHYLVQAQLLYMLGRYDKILQVLAAVKSKNKELQGKVALTQVQALFALKKYQQAKNIATELVKNPTIKDRAIQWVKLLESRTDDKLPFVI